MEECIFCKIIKGEIASDRVYEDDAIIVIKDIKPMAPVHLLAIPKKHIVSIAELAEEDITLMGHMVEIASRMAAATGISGKGFRLVTNSGKEGGQIVRHLHWHILGGRQLSNDLG